MTWTKVWRDFTAKKTRTILVILSIAVGVMAISTVFGTRDALMPQMRAGFERTNPPHISVFVEGGSAELVDDLAALDGIATAQGVFTRQTRWNVGDKWQSMTIQAAVNPVDREIGKIPLTNGSAPVDGELVMENLTVEIADVAVGDTILIESAAGESELTLSGFVYDPNSPSPTVTGVALGYIEMDSAETLFGVDTFNAIHLLVEDTSELAAMETAVNDFLATRTDLAFSEAVARDLDLFPGKQGVDTLLQLMGAIGILALLLSAFLVINTVTTILASEVPHIGTMKAIGATRWAVSRVYLMLVSGYGLLGSLLGLVLGLIGLNILTGFIADLGNIQISGFIVPPIALALGAIVGLIIPIVAALIPVWKATGITVRQAMFSYGIKGGKGRITELLAKISSLPFNVAMSLRNMFRNKGRTFSTILTLTLAGVAFLAVQSANFSLQNTIQTLGAAYDTDFFYTPGGNMAPDEMLAIADGIEGAELAEGWSSAVFTDSDENYLSLLGIPTETDIYRYDKTLADGRWFAADNENGIILTVKYATDNNIVVGDSLKASIDGSDNTWTVVGLVRDLTNSGNVAFGPINTVATAIGEPETINHVRVRLAERSAESINQATEQAVQYGTDLGHTNMRVVDWATQTAQISSSFDIIVLFLMMMVVLVTIVGALGLIGTLTINVTERLKEVGVMRAVGASSRSVAQIFWLEGVLLGLIAWVFAIIIGYPVAKAFTQIITDLLVPIEFSFPSEAMLLVGLGLIIVTTFASLAPALGAARARVGDIIRYG